MPYPNTKNNKISNKQFMYIRPSTIQVLPINILPPIDNLNQLHNNLMRAIPLNNDIKLPLSMRPLIILPFLRIKNRQDILIVISLSHIDIADEISHQETVLSFIHMVHNFVLVVRVDEIFAEADVLFWIVGGLVVVLGNCVGLELIGVD